MHNYFSIIPARKGSKGIINKNLQKIDGNPLIRFTFQACKLSKLLDFAILSSDDLSAISIAKQLKIPTPFKRPASLSRDNSSTIDVVSHALKWYNNEFSCYPENIVLLQPTSPFRNQKDIDTAIKKYEKYKGESLVSVTEVTQHPSDCITIDKNQKIKRLNFSKNKTPKRRQDFEKTYFIDGSIYISSVKRFFRKKTLFDEESLIYFIKKSHAIDIDDPFDLEMARAMKNYNNKNKTNLFDL